MKVLQINTVCGTGSTGRIVMDIYHVLESQGHQCMVAYGRGVAPEGTKSYRIGNDLDMKLHAGLTRITDRHSFYSKRATQKLIREIERYEPDIIHLHNIHGYYLNIPILFEFLSAYRKPVVWTLHDCWSYTGHCAYYSYARCDRWKTGCYQCPEKREYPASVFWDSSTKNYEDKKRYFNALSNLTLVVPSLWMKNQVKQSFMGDYEIEVIPSGINRDIFRRIKSDVKTKYGLDGKHVILGVANIWNARKGLRYFEQLSEMLPEEYQIVLVGVNAEQQQKLPDSIVGLKRTEDQKELAALYSASNVYVNTSTEETQGLTTLESLACGTPVVVFNATAIPEMIGPGTGKAVRVGDVQEMKQAIIQYTKLQEDLREAEDLQRRCVCNVEDYKTETQATKYISIYEKVCTVK